MKRSDFRIIKIEKFDGSDTKTSYRIEYKRLWFWWYLNEVYSIEYAETWIDIYIYKHEVYKTRKTTKTIVG